MKIMRAYNPSYDLPELDDADYSPVYSGRSRIEDANDLGDIGDSFSIGLDMTDADDLFAADL